MEMINGILDRRSIRKFRKGEISDAQINILLEAAMYAPTARDTQSWQFLVVRDPHTLLRIMQAHPYAKMLQYASAAILVCGDMDKEESEGYQITNCSAATQNILLCGHAMGLGSVWLGVYPREERIAPLRELFSLPSHILPISLVAIGYPDETKPRPDRFDPKKIHYEQW